MGKELDDKKRKEIELALSRVLERFPFKDYEGKEVMPNDDTATALSGKLLDAILESLPTPHVVVVTEKSGDGELVANVLSSGTVDFTVFSLDERNRAIGEGRCKPGEAPYIGRHHWGEMNPLSCFEALSYNPDGKGYDSLSDWIDEFDKRKAAKAKKKEKGQGTWYDAVASMGATSISAEDAYRAFIEGMRAGEISPTEPSEDDEDEIDMGEYIAPDQANPHTEAAVEDIDRELALSTDEVEDIARRVLRDSANCGCCSVGHRRDCPGVPEFISNRLRDHYPGYDDYGSAWMEVRERLGQIDREQALTEAA